MKNNRNKLSVKNDMVRIGVSVPAPDQEWTAGALWYAKKAILDWSEKKPNIRFDLKIAVCVEDQVEHVKYCISEGIQYLVILPIESAGLTPIVKQARKNGVYIIDADRGVLDGAHDSYVTGDNYQYGRIAAEWMASELRGSGKIVAILGVPCTIDTLRMKGFHDGIARYPGIRILAEQVGYWNKSKSQAIMENFLDKFRQIDGVYSQDDEVQEAVIKAYLLSSRSDINVFFGGTGQRSTIKKIIDGDPLVRATVTYSPSLIATAISLAALVSGGSSFDGFYQNQIPSQIIIRSELITKNNAINYYDSESVF